MTLPADLTLPGQVRATLERILASPLFLQAERQRRLLGYVVEESLAGRAHRLNQFALAVDVFDRDATFDPAVDAVVRVDVARLRARLREYYEANPDERVVIRIPKGGYVADFDFGAALRGAAPPAATASHDALPVIAVLPFAVIGDAERDAYFADGVSEDLITDLAKISGLRVIARNSSFAYRGRSMPAAAIGRDLGATHLLEGSVRRAGERLRINAQLSACASGEQVWAERYDRDATDIFAVQDQIASKIVTALAVVLSAVDRYRRDGHGTLNLQAYDALLRATALGWAVPEVHDACRLLDVAIGLDGQYSLAYARRADRMWYLWCIGATVMRPLMQPSMRHSRAWTVRSSLTPSSPRLMPLRVSSASGMAIGKPRLAHSSVPNRLRPRTRATSNGTRSVLP